MNQTIRKRIEDIKNGIVPEGYKKTKVGIVPCDWEFGTISNVLHNESRVVAKPKEPYWRVGVRSWAKGTFRALVENPEEVNMDELYIVKENDLVLNITFAWEHAIALATKEDDGLLVSHRFPTYVFDNQNVPQFFKRVVSLERFRQLLDLISPGGAGRNRVLDRKEFLKLPCCIPPVVEQEKIAEILETQDKVIGLKEKLIEQKKQQKKYLMQQLLTGKKRLPGFTGEWELKPIGEYLVESEIIAKPDINQRITVRLHLGGIVKRETKAVEKEEATIQYIRKSGQFIYGKQNFHNGAFGIIPPELDMFQSSSDLPSFDISNEINSIWFYNYCAQKDFYKKMEITSTGTGSKRTNPSVFLKTKIRVPKLEEQQAIADILSKADKEIELLQKDLEEEKNKKKALMQLLLTGIVRVV